MNINGLKIKKTPALTDPILIAGFDGWGNAMNVSAGMAAYLIDKYEASPFASIVPDDFYRFDESRPIVEIESGILKSVTPPGGAFYTARPDPSGRDIVILEADEPNLGWFRFTDAVFSLCEMLGVKTIITLGSMHDRVLHTDRIISGVVSDNFLLARLERENVHLSDYQGPGAIHTLLQSEGPGRGFHCMSLWCHCPFYLQGVTHFGLLSALASVLSSIGEFRMDRDEIEAKWQTLNKQIQDLMEESPEARSMVDQLRKERREGSWKNMMASIKGDKVINLKDFLDSR